MQIAKNQNGIKIPASSLVKRVHDIEGERYYCIHCGIEVIPRIGERGLSHYAKHNEVLHKPLCPEIYLNTSVKLPSSNSKKINFKEAKDAILKNINFLNLEDYLYKVDVKDLLVTKNNLPTFNNKQTYIVLTEVINTSGCIIGLDCGLKIKADEIEIQEVLKVGTKFMLVTPIMEKTLNITDLNRIYFYNDMDEKEQDYFDNICLKVVNV